MKALVRAPFVMAGMMFVLAVGPAAAIVGGYLVPPGKLRFAARVLTIDGSNHGQCSGSVVSPTVVMTAARCVVDASTGRTISPRDVVVLPTGPDGNLGATYAHRVGRVTRFPRIAVATRRGGIALLQLTSRSAADVVRVAGSADAAWGYRAGWVILVAGFGKLSTHAPSNPLQPLHAVRFAVLDDAVCKTSDTRGLPYIARAMF